MMKGHHLSVFLLLSEQEEDQIENYGFVVCCVSFIAFFFLNQPHP